MPPESHPAHPANKSTRFDANAPRPDEGLPRHMRKYKGWLRADQMAWLDTVVLFRKAQSVNTGENRNINRGTILRELIDRAMEENYTGGESVRKD